MRQREEEGKRFSELEASQIMKSVLSAVDYIHQMGIVHRDLKPGKRRYNRKYTIRR
jgi:serine/threonine protein kinase